METNAIAKIDVLDTEVSGLKVDVANLDKRMSNLGDKLDTGLGKLFDRLESQNSRGTPWGYIFAAASVFVAVALGLSGWANAYFGQSIAFAQREAARALEAHGAMQTQINENRRESMEAAIYAARLDERQKSQAAEIDRLRQAGQSAPRP